MWREWAFEAEVEYFVFSLLEWPWTAADIFPHSTNTSKAFREKRQRDPEKTMDWLVSSFVENHKKYIKN